MAALYLVGAWKFCMWRRSSARSPAEYVQEQCGGGTRGTKLAAGAGGSARGAGPPSQTVVLIFVVLDHFNEESAAQFLRLGAPSQILCILLLNIVHFALG